MSLTGDDCIVVTVTVARRSFVLTRVTSPSVPATDTNASVVFEMLTKSPSAQPCKRRPANMMEIFAGSNTRIDSPLDAQCPEDVDLVDRASETGREADVV